MRLPTYSVFDYYVSPSGSSGNTGLTSGSPWDWATWLANDYRGKVTKFLNGTYSLTSGGDYDLPVINVGGGCYEFPTVIVAETTGSVILSLGSNANPAIGQRYDQGCVTMIGLKVTGGTGAQYLFQGQGNTDASHGVRLSNCQSASGVNGFYVYNGGYAGILLDAFSATTMSGDGIHLTGDDIARVDSPVLTACNVGIRDVAAAGKTTLRSPTFSGCTTNRIGV